MLGASIDECGLKASEALCIAVPAEPSPEGDCAQGRECWAAALMSVGWEPQVHCVLQCLQTAPATLPRACWAQGMLGASIGEVGLDIKSVKCAPRSRGMLEMECLRCYHRSSTL